MGERRGRPLLARLGGVNVFLSVGALLIVLVLVANFWLVEVARGDDARGLMEDSFAAASALFSGIAALVVIAAILLQQQDLDLQRDELRRSLELSANASVAQRQSVVDQMFLDHPELWACFGAEANLDPPPPELSRSCFHAMANFIESYLVQRDEFGQLFGVAEWDRYIGWYLENGHGLREFITEHSAWFTSDLLARVSEIDTGLAQGSGGMSGSPDG